MHYLSVLPILLLSVLTANAECPNGCSGHGSCTSKDMCQCYKNFQGNDCSERTCGFGYAHTDTPKGDLNMDGAISTGLELSDSQVYPYSTYELYNPNAVNNEGHFYMECSNQGLCDREVGDCICFDGFEGSACQRASCPNSCSGHGSCESISEFASTAGGTLFTKGLSSGDTTYALWDAKVSYGCRCDPWFTGPDCSQRLCKVGVDPMYFDSQQVTYETIGINVVKVSDLATTDYIQLRFWDYWGESYITDRIFFTQDAANDATAIQNALQALPNGVIDRVSCKTYSGTVTDFFDTGVTAANSLSMVLCQFTSNPGELRLPEIYAAKSGLTATIVSTPLRGEDENLCTTLHPNPVTAVGGNDQTDLTVVHSLGTTDVYLAKYRDQYLAVTASNGKLTAASQFTATAVSSLSEDLYILSTKLDVGSTLNTNDAAVGDTTITLADVTDFAAGNKIIIENQIYNIVSIDNNVLTIDRPFFGVASTAAAAEVDNNVPVYQIPVSTTTTYVSECSGRGLCDRESGVCTCFRGYTNDNCDSQSTMAF